MKHTMPGTTLPTAPRYILAQPTKEDRESLAFLIHLKAIISTQLPFYASVDWADLAVIDISKARTPEGRAELAPQIRHVMRTVGFFYVVNHGMTKEQART